MNLLRCDECCNVLVGEIDEKVVVNYQFTTTQHGAYM